MKLHQAALDKLADKIQAFNVPLKKGTEAKQAKDLIFSSFEGGIFQPVPVIVYSAETCKMQKIQLEDRDKDYSKLIIVSGKLFELSHGSLNVYPELKDSAPTQKQHLADLP